MIHKPISLSAYAKHRGVSIEAVRRARDSGRLEGAIVIVLTAAGKPQSKIASVEAADRAWARNTASSSIAGPDIPSFADSRARREAARAGLATLQLMRERGRLVSVDAVRAAVAAKFSEVRTKLLGVPTRLKQRSAIVADDDVRLVDELIREALEALADGKISTH